MRNFYAIYRKEMGHYFVSPVAYVVIGIFLLASGFFFRNILIYFINYAMEMGFQEMRMGGASAVDVPGLTLRSFFGVLGTISLFLLPMLTMGVYSEERRHGTMELLMTSPVSDTAIVLGKFAASLSLFAIMLLPTFCYQLILYFTSDPHISWKLILVGYLGLLLLGATLLAIGTFLSSLTESQIIAGVTTFGLFLMLWVIDLGSRGSGGLSSVLQYLSIIHHFDDFTRGVIDLSNVLFYVSLAFFGVFLTLRSVDAMRWRRA